MSALTYQTSGVNIGAADQSMGRLKRLIRSTHGPGVMPDRGQFAGLFELSMLRLKDPILVSSTDGVGTKLALAESASDYRALGIDAVAMNTNDILVYGAQPIFFLDYVAVGKLQPRIFDALLEGVVEGCKQSGCALIGGETAEMPGIYEPHEFDVAGFCVGAVERKRLLNGTRVRSGDVIIGLASSGVHANGFSLVRAALCAEGVKRHKAALMKPTRIYVKPVLEVLRRHELSAIAHVTGGGLTRRVPSLVSAVKGLRASWEPERWPLPAIFQQIQRAGLIDAREMYRTFNMGIGMVVACRAAVAQAVINSFARRQVPAWPIGRIERSAA